MEKIKFFLEKNSIEFHENFDLSTISSIKIGQNARLVIFPKNSKELEKIILFFDSKKIFYRVFGNLSNVLFVSSIGYPIIVTNKMCEGVQIDGEKVVCPAGIPISKLAEILKRKGLSGLEGVTGIPATVGGAIKSNAGAFGTSISDHLVCVRVALGGKIFNLSKNEINFSYHLSNLDGFIIISATFLFVKSNEYDIINLSNKYSYLRSVSQPSGLSLGSVFDRVGGKSAGFYIERCGLKGQRVGGIIISNKHANFFINDKNGTSQDFLRLVALVQISVLKQFGLTLSTEIEKVGEKDEVIGRFAYAFKKQ